jgi:hypothetical protein
VAVIYIVGMVGFYTVKDRKTLTKVKAYSFQNIIKLPRPQTRLEAF